MLKLCLFCNYIQYKYVYIKILYEKINEFLYDLIKKSQKIVSERI
jgi:hypothetical protein